MASADVAICIVLLLSAAIGLVRGLVKETLSLVTWGAAFVLALAFAQPASELLGLQIDNPSIRFTVGFGFVFVLVLIAGGIVTWLVGRLVVGTGLTGTDRFLGFLFGSARGVIVSIVVLIAVRSFAQDTAWWQASSLIPQLLAFEQIVLDLLGVARDSVSGLGVLQR